MVTNVVIFMRASVIRIKGGFRIATVVKTGVSCTCRMSLLLNLMLRTDGDSRLPQNLHHAVTRGGPGILEFEEDFKVYKE